MSVSMTGLRWRSQVASRTLLAWIAGFALSSFAMAQDINGTPGNAVELPQFEAATINPHPPGELVSSVGGPPGIFEAKNVTAKMLVQMAFNLPANQVSGGPQWVAAQRFDVTAKIPDAQWEDLNKPGDGDRDQLVQRMLQSLLIRRFHLAVSHQQKDLLVFALVASKSGAKLPVAGASQPEPIERQGLLMAMDQDDVPVSALANFLSAHFGRTVLDCTGLSKRYDISLKVEIPDEISPETVDRAIFQALEDQLGLKLATRRMVLDTIVIDRLEQPADD